MQLIQSRRHFLASMSAAGAAGVLGVRASLADEGPPEVTTIRLAKIPGICIAPQYLEDLLRVEGFTDVRYIPTQAGTEEAIKTARGEIDVSMNFVGPTIISMDAGEPLVMLAGIHPGCFELFGNSRIRAIADLKGKSVGVLALGSGQHVFLASMATYVGLDPAKDINWVASTSPKPMELFADGRIDAFLGFPPEPQELRARHIGNVIVDSATDRPWSQYFCCLLTSNTDFVHKYPIATKRAVRAVLKGADLCVADPERVCSAARRWRIHHEHRVCPPDARRSSLWQVAGVRPRGHDAVLCAAAARGGDDQVHPQQDHRRGHRLALPERAQARAEGVSERACTNFARDAFSTQIKDDRPLPGLPARFAWRRLRGLGTERRTL
jgi:NitT/TauT family transport system substrate-binding protein